MRSDVVRLFQTLPHPCGYYPERTAQNLVIDPAESRLAALYDTALARGYRRAGGHVYLPHCQTCRACLASRIVVAEFEPDRSQRRCLKRNADLSMEVTVAGFSDERHALYARYLRKRHPGGGMDEAAPEDFTRFLYTSWSPTAFIEFRANGRLVAVAVTDLCSDALSAVYTFFDPAESARGLGTFAILSQIELARARGLAYVYLGFWIPGHPKMDYKRRFHPLEILDGGRWVPTAHDDDFERT
ncbi:arginyltransferase [Dokdonella sp.]|uniref:arginyltransferase n=1 Tax=Dokdonella sp. TaxID=2291710 RepID=UPI0025B80AAE|nr:arginyltransferase [Dokdonella sp.]MBX3692631.1 arginyltransferase [Dokdonella sp.]MCW5567374.1 arginyltransferase [Dokdonella sp.]